MNYTRGVLFGMLVVAALLLGACQPQISTRAELEQECQATLDDIVRKGKDVHNAVLMVQSPTFEWKGAAGMSDPDAEIAMTPDDQYRTASSAKMMLATLTLKLSEQGLIELDAPIAGYLPADIIAGLHVYEGQDYSDRITTRQLLHHTSGLADDWFDERDDGRFVQMALEDETDRLWEPAELVSYVKDNLPPLFAPGDGINYSDVNFVLAGLVIESVTGQQLHDVYREQLFAPLSMEHTYMEFREEARPSVPGRTLSHVFYGDVDYTSFRSLSADWAGGGLVTTAEDMTRFMRAFVNNDIFANPDTRDAMFDWMPWEGDTLDYGLGLMRVKGKTLTIWGHMGVGQSFMFYWPDGDLTLCGTLNQQEADAGAVMSRVLKAVRSYQNPQQ